MPLSMATATAVPMGETPQVGDRQVEAASMPLGEAPRATSLSSH